jgi:hypothetical protein
MVCLTVAHASRYSDPLVIYVIWMRMEKIYEGRNEKLRMHRKRKKDGEETTEERRERLNSMIKGTLNR